MDAAEGRLNTPESKIGTLESEMDAAELRLTTNEADIDTINGTLYDLKDHYADHLADFEAEVAELDGHVAFLQDNVTAARTRVDGISFDLDAVERNISLYNQYPNGGYVIDAVASLAQWRIQAKESIKANEDNIAIIEEDVEDNRLKTVQLQNEILDNKGDIIRLERDMDGTVGGFGVTRRIETLEDHLTGENDGFNVSGRVINVEDHLTGDRDGYNVFGKVNELKEKSDEISLTLVVTLARLNDLLGFESDWEYGADSPITTDVLTLPLRIQAIEDLIKDHWDRNEGKFGAVYDRLNALEGYHPTPAPAA
jgi:predicted  nucleic acid-binding Zn-ribbon protein